MSFAPLSFKVTTTLAAYRIVKMAAANTVAYGTAASDKIMGVTSDDVKNTNEAIPVKVAGIAKVQFNDSCAVGAFVTCDNLGYGVPMVVNTAGVYAIGQLIGPAVNATGTIADVLLMPQQLSIP